jgi:Zn-dependent peptidase ImmA (M78 family)
VAQSSTRHVDIHPALFRWARERARLDPAALAKRFPRLTEWEAGTAKPTFRQLENFADATAAPFGYMFLHEPPEEPLPIPDFRTLGDRPIRHPSPNLLDTIHEMQRRQAWMREERIEEGQEPLPFVGSVTVRAVPSTVAAALRRTLGVADGWAALHGTWTEALRALRERVENVGVIVVINGVVGNNTHRKLDPDEFRGFVLSDEFAPFVFINGADGKGAQMFTFAHELAHLCIGQGGLFDLQDMQPSGDPSERFCNAVAAEFLIPQDELRRAWNEVGERPQPFSALARRFKVSELVAARRALDARLIDREAFSQFYGAYELDERRRAARQSTGGDFYANQNSRVGRVFAEAIARAAKEGRLLYRDAYQLTGLRGEIFDRYIAKLEAGARR